MSNVALRGTKLFFLRDCDNCGYSEERVFTDSLTGLELCLPCLTQIAGQIHLTPSESGDNLEKLLEDVDTDTRTEPWN